MKTGYTAFIIKESSRNLLLNKFKPKFEKVFMHHITYRFKVKEDSFIPNIIKAIIIGYASNDNIEALVVSLADSIHREDGSIYHITISVKDGHSPVESNHLLKNKKYELIDPIEVDIEPKFVSF